MADNSTVPRKNRVRTLRRFRLAWEPATAIVILTGLLAIALLAPRVFSDPNAIALEQRLKPPRWAEAEGSGILGTDPAGRDVLSRLAHGARITLLVAALSVFFAAAVGVSVGVLSGYYGGPFDQIAMGLVDVQLSLPFMLIAIFLAAVLGARTENTVLVLTITGWALYARIVRGEVVRIRELEFVEASRALGGRDRHIIWRIVLPNVLSTMAVVASVTVARIILAEASLSFLGLGIQPPTPSWGTMIAESRNYLNVAWWTVLFPGLAISLAVLAANLAGNWLRDRLDPRTARPVARGGI